MKNSLSRMASGRVVLCFYALLVYVAVRAANYDIGHDEFNSFDDSKERLHEQAVQPRNKRQAKNPAQCEKKIFEHVMDCCDAPMLLPLSGLQNCSAGRVTGDHQVVRMLGRKLFKRLANKTKPAKAGGFRNITGGPLCVFECVFNSLGLLQGGALLDVQPLTSKFLAGVSDDWKSVVQAGLNNCTAQLAALNTTSLMTTPPGGRICNPAPVLLMACLYRHNIMNCPDAVKFTGDSQRTYPRSYPDLTGQIVENFAGSNCKTDVQKLGSCDIFSSLRPNVNTP